MLLLFFSRDGHLGHVTWTIYTNLHSPFIRMLHVKFGFDYTLLALIGQVVSEEKIFEIVEDGRRSMGIL